MNFTQLLSEYAESKNRSLENSNINRVRHNVYTPEGKKALKLFEKVVGLMKERSAQNHGDPLGWSYQAGIHGLWNLNYEQPAEFSNSQEFVDFAVANGFDTRENILNGNTVLNNCTHFAQYWNGSPGSITQKTGSNDGGPANFMAWHRIYLQYFEEVARENLRLSGDPNSDTWALPYWAYLNEDQAVMPDLLRDPNSSLYTPYRNPDFNAGTSILELSPPQLRTQPADWSDRALRGLGETGYLAMGSTIENVPHNQFHLLSGLNGGLFPISSDSFSPEGDGLMVPTASAAFDPIFWIHHSFIDKIWSAYNKTDNAFYAFEYEFDQNPWNYVFLTPSLDGSPQKDVISDWGDGSKNVISKLYNPDYSYDYFGTLSNPVDDLGPNKVLSLLQSPAFRPIVSEISWGRDTEANSRILSNDQQISFHQATIPLAIDGKKLIYETYQDFAGDDEPFNVVVNIHYQLPSPPAFARFLVTTKSIAEEQSHRLFEVSSRFDWANRGLYVQDMPMGSMPMAKTSIMDLAFEDYSYFPDGVDANEEIVLLMVSNAANTSVKSLSLGLTQNFKRSTTQDSDFDAAAYFSQFPELLLNRDATEDPEGYYNSKHKSQGVVAPEINFRAAALGITYLAENPDLIEVLDSSSPYVAIADYLDNGLAQGRSLGDASLRSSQNYFRRGADSDAIIFDLSLLPSGGETSLEVVTGRESKLDSVLGFYRIVDDLGTVIIDGVSYKPDDPDYERMAKSDGNLFDQLTGLSSSPDVADRRTGIELTKHTGKLAPFVVVDGETFFTFADANSDGINHFRSLAPNTLGFEDFWGGGDTDFDDLLAAFRFTSPSSDIA